MYREHGLKCLDFLRVMDLPRGRWPRIYWTGPGSKADGLHTKKEFLRIMYEQYPESVYWRRRGEKEIPPGKIKKRAITEWMAFARATYV